jgi:hypothetical protein
VKLAQETEPPSCPHSTVFMVGQDSHGNWVVQDQNGIRGGLFVDRAQALRFVRFETGNRSQAFINVGGTLELDMTQAV